MSAEDQQATTIRQVADGVSPSVVRIGRHGGRGCGVVVAGHGLVVTAQPARPHDAGHLRRRPCHPGHTGIDVDGDLGVLAVDTGGVPAVTWSEGQAELGQAVAVARISGHRVTAGTTSRRSTARSEGRGAGW